MGTQVSVFPLFLLRQRLKIINGVFYEIFIKSKKYINVFCFQIIIDETNHDYLFQ